MISIALPTYHGAAYIRATLESLLSQSYTDFEVIVSDDASTDNTVEIIESFDDERIKLFRHPSNIGPEQNWNYALQQCRGEFIKMMGQDDLLHPDCLALQHDALIEAGHEDVALVICRRKIINAKGNTILTRGFKRHTGQWLGSEALAVCVRAGGNLLGEPVAGLFRRKAIEGGAQFHAALPFFIDMDFWAQLIVDKSFYYQQEPLCSFRVSSTAWSAVLLHEQSQQWRALLKHFRKTYPQLPVSALGWTWGLLHGTLRYGIIRKLFYRYIVKS